jgi:hemerythrin-like domain-containing protein
MPHRLKTDAQRSAPADDDAPSESLLEQPQLLSRLLQDHVDARRVLVTLESEVDRIAQHRMPNAAALSEAIGFFGAYMGRLHHPIEDLIYGALRRRAPLRAAELNKIATEHTEAPTMFAHGAEAVGFIIANPEASRFQFCRAMRNFIAFERHHLRREENAFFAYAREYLTPQDWAEITSAARSLEVANPSAEAAQTAGKTRDGRS